MRIILELWLRFEIGPYGQKLLIMLISLLSKKEMWGRCCNNVNFTVFWLEPVSNFLCDKQVRRLHEVAGLPHITSAAYYSQEHHKEIEDNDKIFGFRLGTKTQENYSRERVYHGMNIIMLH